MFGVLSADIRCYCNDASCVSTGYMCKSAMGKCYSQLSYDGDDSRPRHGCAEFLGQQDRSICAAKGDIIKTRTGPSEEWPILRCCQDDMCNYLDNMNINIHVNTKSNGSILKGKDNLLNFYFQFFNIIKRCINML